MTWWAESGSRSPAATSSTDKVGLLSRVPNARQATITHPWGLFEIDILDRPARRSSYVPRAIAPCGSQAD
jgi:hypothetical protein